MSTFMRVCMFCVGAWLSAGVAEGQRLAARPNVYVTPRPPLRLGVPITLGVRPTVSGTTYTYVAQQTTTGSGRASVSVGCAAAQTLGSGDHITWKPYSGSYRVSVVASARLTKPDTTVRSVDVIAPHGGWLSIAVTQAANPVPPGSLTLQLSTNDRGAGHRYQWLVRFRSLPGPLPMLDWSGDSPAATITATLNLVPGTYDVTARVGAYRGSPCQVVETSDGTLNGQVVR